MALNVGFAGTPAFAAEVLAALLEAGFPISVVLTQPDRPRARGLKSGPSPVKQLAERSRLAVRQPRALATEAAQAELRTISLDVLIVAAYGLILPATLLAWPRRGCVNVHASLLPRWRGAAPIQRALLAGDAESGITLMQMDAGLDTGPMLERIHVPIATRETAGTLERKLAVSGARAAVDFLRAMESGVPAKPPLAQPAEGVTYAAKIDKREARIDWRATALQIERQIRAFDPAPGAFAVLDEQVVKVWEAEVAGGAEIHVLPGTIVETTRSHIAVACGRGGLCIRELQPAGGKRMSASAFVAGRRIAPGARFQLESADDGAGSDLAQGSDG